MYNYAQEMYKDIYNYCESYYDVNDWETAEEMEDALYDELFVSDITGNDATYFKTVEEAWAAVSDNRQLLIEVLTDFDGDWKRALTDPHYADTLIRCYFLPDAIHRVVAEIFPQ